MSAYPLTDTTSGRSLFHVLAAGTLICYAGTDIPPGYLLCDGRSVNSDDYPELFDAIGYTFGGSGSSFSVPNLENRFIRGTSSNRALGNPEEDRVKNHGHELEGNTKFVTDNFSYLGINGTAETSGDLLNDPDVGPINIDTTSSQTGFADESRPKNVSLRVLIKHKNY